MESVTRKPTKTIDEYRHNIKLLKYHLKKEEKLNETLRYKQSKRHRQQSAIQKESSVPKANIYALLDTINRFSSKLREMGLTLGDVFRMADATYAGEVTREQFVWCITKIKANLEEHQINEMFYAIDEDLNNMLSQDEYASFLAAYGGSNSKDAHYFQSRAAESFAAALSKKSMRVEGFIKNMLDPVDADDISKQLKDLGMNANQTMSLLKMWDPTLTGSVRHDIYLKSMKDVKRKNQKEIEYEKMEKGISELCVLFRDNKFNPI